MAFNSPRRARRVAVLGVSPQVLYTMGRVVGKAHASATTTSLAKTTSKLQETKAMAEEAARDKVLLTLA